MNETVLVAMFYHETNTFVDERTDRDSYRTSAEHFGDDVPHHYRGTETALGGIIEVGEEAGVDLAYTVAANATPGGPVTRDTYDFYVSEIADGAREHVHDIAGVVLALHGGMVPEGMDDGEGPLISTVREIVGPDIPIVVTLDLHGNVTGEMVDSADAIVAYETNPHLDMADTGRNGMHLLVRSMRDAVAPTMHCERPPLLPEVPKQYTSAYPMAKVMARARELEERAGVLKVSVLPGFYHADVPEAGLSVPVVTDGDPGLAEAVSRELAGEIWAMREEFVGEYPTPEEAVEKAKLLSGLIPEPGPIVLADFGPNPGAGGSASGTVVLREFIDQGLENAGYTLLWDPDAVDQCIEAGVGERVTLTIGGWPDDRHGDPIEEVDGYVKAITDGTFTNTGTSHDGAGTVNHLGRAVRLQCGRSDGVNVILTENRTSSFDAEIWRHVGIQPERLDVIAVQSLAAFRGDYGPFAAQVIEVDSPGLSSPIASRFDIQRIDRPKFPLDEMRDDAYPS